MAASALFNRCASLATRLLVPSRAAAAAAATTATLGFGLVAGAPTSAFADATERSFIMIKPDGVQRGLIAEIISRFERRGYKLVGIKMMQPSQELAEKHYEDLSSKPFYGKLTKFLASGPIVAMIWEGDDVVKGGRTLLGTTDPKDSLPGSIRGDFSLVVGKNVIHGSDSVESAQREIKMWFSEKEITPWASVNDTWLYE